MPQGPFDQKRMSVELTEGSVSSELMNRQELVKESRIWLRDDHCTLVYDVCLRKLDDPIKIAQDDNRGSKGKAKTRKMVWSKKYIYETWSLLADWKKIEKMSKMMGEISLHQMWSNTCQE